MLVVPGCVPDDPNASLCNGHGECIDEFCTCYDGYSGLHCTYGTAIDDVR